jgi:hypothetical protein
LALLCGELGPMLHAQLVTDVSQCASGLAQTCGGFSTTGVFNCSGCLNTAGCGWCAAGTSGSCHAGTGDANSTCALLFNGAASYLTGTAQVSQCPISSVANFCPLHFGSPCACLADPTCGWCLDFTSATVCIAEGRCLTSDQSTACTGNAALFQPAWYPAQSDCNALPEVCSASAAPSSTAALTSPGGSSGAPPSGTGATTTSAVGGTLPSSSGLKVTFPGERNTVTFEMLSHRTPSLRCSDDNNQ